MSEQGGHYEGTPGPKKGKTLATWQDFQGELKEREHDIAMMLPRHVGRDRFLASALAAVKQNPDLLAATPRSLFSAITKSAQDGILPDGREGVISIYNTKIKVNGKDVWEKTAQWNPMAAGLRKRARELDDIIIDAQVVYENDHFIWHQGDDPRIEHEPAKLGTPRGSKIGAYAIFKREDGIILHREVMDVVQIKAVRDQSKAPDSLMWTKFEEEGFRKSVIRRGIKTVPVSENLEQIVRRDDELFDFSTDRDAAPALAPPPAPPAPRVVPGKNPKRDASAPRREEAPIIVSLPGEWQEYLERQRDEFAVAVEAAMKQGVCDAVADAITNARERGELSGEDAETISGVWGSMIETGDG